MPAPQPETVELNLAELRGGEDGDEGPIQSHDLHLVGRGIRLLVNVKPTGEFSYALIVDVVTAKHGWRAAVSPLVPAPPEPQPGTYLKQAARLSGCAWKCHSKYVDDGWNACCSTCQRIATEIAEAVHDALRAAAARSPTQAWQPKE